MCLSGCEWKRWTTKKKLGEIEAWAREGLTMSEISARMGCAPEKLRAWRAACAAIDEALSRGREAVDEVVEDALFKKCTGYTIPVKKAIKLKRVLYDNGKKTAEEEHIEEGAEETYVPPSVTAQMFWLKARKPDAWRGSVQEEIAEGEKGDFTLHIGGESARED